MDGAGHTEPAVEVQDGGKNEVSDDSDSEEAIIELDQSQIASPSDSEEEKQVQESQQTPDAPSDKASEHLDPVSDNDDMPDDIGEVMPTSIKETLISPKDDDSVHEKTGDRSDTLAGDSGDSLAQGLVVAQPADVSASHNELEATYADKLKDRRENRHSFQTSSESSDQPLKDSIGISDCAPQPGADRSEHISTGEEVTRIAESSVRDLCIQDSMQDEVCKMDASNVGPPEAVSTTADGKETVSEGEDISAAKGSVDVQAIGDDVSDVSSDGEVPLSPADEQSVEKLTQEAAHQAEALASLGAEPVSEPESGEDMGSDESSPPQSPGFSPAIVTSTSRISLGGNDYTDVRARISNRSPRNSDSAIISDSASSLQPLDKSDRLSLEDSTIPPTFSASDNKLDLSASLDMENISDDENIGEDNDSEDTSGEIEDDPEPEIPKADEAVISSSNQPEDDAQKSSIAEKTGDGERVRRPIMIASLGDKQQVQTHFNEEQVELDYEDVDGDGDADPGEIKPEDEDDGKEEGEDSDRDEGEIDDDDDCEEGEIKEPGTSKKPFVKPACRFFQRGTCTWGLNCRFLHPGVNDKGNYQMIELPGQRWNGPPGHMGGNPWGQEAPEELMELPPPPPEVPPVESAWERGLRHAKEQMKKASQRKEQESNFEEKRLNLSVDEEREMNKENERRMVVHAPIVKDPYYDQAAFDEEEYYKQRGANPWHTGRYENFEVRYTRDTSYSPPPPPPYIREKEYYPPPPERYPRHFSPPVVDKFGRHPRIEPPRHDPPYRNNRADDVRPMSPTPPMAASSPPSRRPADEWHDPWRRHVRRSKSPKTNRRGRSRSRSRRGRRSLSDSSFSSEQKRRKRVAVPAGNTKSSRSGSRSSGSHSSRSRSRSSASSRSRSRSPEPAPPGVERGERNERNFGGQNQGRFMDGPRSAVSVRARGGGYRRDHDGRPGYQNRNRGGNFQRDYHDQRHRMSNQLPKVPERSFPAGYGYNRPTGRGRQPERRIPPDALRPKRTHSNSSSGSSHSRSWSRSGSASSSSVSRSRSGSASAGSRSRSRSRSASQVSSRSSSSSSSSSGSADSDNLYRDLGGPSQKKKSVKPKDKNGTKPPHVAGPGRASREDRKRSGDQIPRRPPGPPLPAAGSDHPPPRPRGEGRPEGRGDGRPERPADSRPDRPAPPLDRPERLPPTTDRPERLPPQDRTDQFGRVSHPPPRPDRPSKPERADRPPRPDRAERPDRGERMERERIDMSRADRPERVERAERDRGMVGAKPSREQSSRQPAPAAQPKAKDPMKLIGLKSNIKLSLVSKQPSDRPGAGVSSPLKRRPGELGEGPPSKRPAMSVSPVKMPSEKAAKPSSGRERARSPSERQPRSGSAAIPASLPLAMAASIPLPPSPAKPRPPPAKSVPHPPLPPPNKAAPPQPVVTPPPVAAVQSPVPSRSAPAGAGAAPATPPGAAGAAATSSAAKAKRSTTSRREELLKQLRAVEDAIARKKAKMQ